MPSLIRLIVILAVIGAAIYGALWSLAYLVEPAPREMTITVPHDRFER